MQTGRLTRIALATALMVGVATVGVAQTQTAAVEPPAAGVEDYLPPENLDPNLMAIQIKRQDDRILALEQNQEKLVERVEVLTEKFNELVQYLNGAGGGQSQ